MNGIMIILTLLSGVALFLFGMSLMGDGLKSVAGNKLELVFAQAYPALLSKGLLLADRSNRHYPVFIRNHCYGSRIRKLCGMMKVSARPSVSSWVPISVPASAGWILCLSYIEGSSGIAQLLSTATISSHCCYHWYHLQDVCQKDNL